MTGAAGDLAAAPVVSSRHYAWRQRDDCSGASHHADALPPDYGTLTVNVTSISVSAEHDVAVAGLATLS
jgi:hypothetical protein